MNLPPRKIRVRRLTVRLGLLSTALGLWAAVTACSSSGGKRPADGGNLDGFSVDYRFGDLPPGCPPTAGNEKNVGNPCLKTGAKTQCGQGLVCACQDFNGFYPPEDTPCFCTIPILGMVCTSVPAGYCGSGASCCSYMNIGSICVPDVCLPEMQCPVF